MSGIAALARMAAGLTAMVRKEFRQTFRDKRMVIMITVVPLVQLIAFGYAVDLDVEHLATVVCDLDGTAASRDILRAFTATEVFDLAWSTMDPGEASRALETGEAEVALILPRGFGADLAGGRGARAQVLVDGTNPVIARAATAASAEIFTLASSELILARVGVLAAVQGAEISVPMVTVEPRVYYNPTLRSRIFMVPGVAATLLLIVTTITTAVGIAREREHGTLEQIMVTPMSRATFILGKTIPYAVLGYFDVILVLTAGIMIFGVPARGSFALLAVATGLYLAGTLGTGLLISTMSTTMQQAYMGAFLFIMPAILLSGFLTPVENMPWWLQPLAMANPVRYFVEVLRGSLLRDARWGELWPQLAALAAFGGGILGLAVMRFRKRGV